jgi:hypothetical protein
MVIGTSKLAAVLALLVEQLEHADFLKEAVAMAPPWAADDGPDHYPLWVEFEVP